MEFPVIEAVLSAVFNVYEILFKEIVCAWTQENVSENTVRISKNVFFMDLMVFICVIIDLFIIVFFNKMIMSSY